MKRKTLKSGVKGVDWGKADFSKTDAENARVLKCSAATVKKNRLRAGGRRWAVKVTSADEMASAYKRLEKLQVEVISDSAAARMANCTGHAVASYREARGIPKFTERETATELEISLYKLNKKWNDISSVKRRLLALKRAARRSDQPADAGAQRVGDTK